MVVSLVLDLSAYDLLDDVFKGDYAHHLVERITLQAGVRRVGSAEGGEE
jgi:hypothetical protein